MCIGFILGFVMTLSNFGFMAAMLTFFIAGSKVTKWRSSHKRKFELDFKEGCSKSKQKNVVLLRVISTCVCH